MSEKSSGHTGAERITMVISVLILVGIVGLAVWSYSQQGDNPARFSVETHTDQVRVEESGYYVPVTVTNTGGKTAQDVTVVGELTVGNRQPETVEFTLAFLAGGESETGVLIFQEDPAVGEVTVVVGSYVEP